MNTSLTLRETLTQLAAEGIALPDDYENVITGLQLEKKVVGSPWYLRLFVGLSAWIAAILFVAFLFTANVLQNEESGLIWGLLVCAFAVGLHRFGPRNDFLSQFGLALSLVGQLLFLIGLFGLSNMEIVSIALGMIILELVLLWAYNAQLHQMISTLVILGAILAILFDLEFTVGVHLFIFGLAAGVMALSYKKNHLLVAGFEGPAKSASYGLAVFLLGLLLLPLLEYFDLWWITAVLLLAVLLFLVLQIAADLGLDLHRGAVLWLCIGCVLLLIPAVRMPGILGALLILLLGFWRNARLLIGLAAAFLLFYLGAYYYSLQWTLLVKSFALMGTGAILFLLRYILLRFARGGAS